MKRALVEAAAAAAQTNYPSDFGKGLTVAGWQPYFCILGRTALAVSDPKAFCAMLFAGQREDGFVPALSGAGAAALPVQGFLLGSVLRNARKSADLMAPALKLAFDRTVMQHHYLYAHRDPAQEGLIAIQYPEEDGFGNAPAYDLQAGEPPGIQDPFFNTCLTWSNEALLAVGRFLGENVPEIMQWHELTIHSMNEKLWDEREGRYQAYDLRNNCVIPVQTLAGILPLAAEIPTQDQAERILKLLEGKPWKAPGSGMYASCRMDAPFADWRRGWSGPTWLAFNWMLYQGFLRYGFLEAAASLRNAALKQISKFGFHDAYDPTSGDGSCPGIGSSPSPGAAALALHWLNK